MKCKPKTKQRIIVSYQLEYGLSIGQCLGRGKSTPGGIFGLQKIGICLTRARGAAEEKSTTRHTPLDAEFIVEYGRIGKVSPGSFLSAARHPTSPPAK